MGREDKRRKKRNKGRFILGFFLVLLLIGAGLAFTVYQSLQNTLGGEVLHSNKRTEDVSLQKKEAFTVLLLGVDERKGDVGRSDTMLFLSVNGDNNTAKILSIPRDTRVKIVGKGTKDKINHAYAFGGVKMAVETVENFLDMPVDYYVEMNMEGMKELIDAVGGVEVQNDSAFSYGGDHFVEGHITLSGSEALNYIRMRKEDPNGDFGRQARQRQVMEGILDKGSDPAVILQLTDVMQAIGDNVETNLSISDMLAIQKNYTSARNHIQTVTMDGTSTKIGGVYYYVVEDEEVARVSNEFKEHLNLK
ncbi:LCP family protein [Domibacillus sp. DTU_2020_1001157_1_SI_ALB_TIR_016]|uniref:LCP family glycopolymer transferase n=1 Tax=Domibacillus sp. DTU_2020_1001157_1_SI_ALB_TIR_016 TaxID=3077789 RepID=UPI0028E941CB|nr:LCP family protein [Domibacillus sp. DTU_2020_1001157_1_SI_ALB_TIR_016]WNS78187.1 LCP family protein [Domibacillus sp. DTU_2020_1001157_1_SI_ALB_TIR_016]